MPREPFVHEGVVGAQQIEDAAILAERASEQQPRFLFEGLEQALVEIRIDIGIDDHFTNPTQVQPLSRKVVDERSRRARIVEHALHLLLEHRGLRQLSALGGIEQPLVRNAVPQEKGQARCEFEIAQWICPSRSTGRTRTPTRRGITMDTQQEIGIDEHPFERELNPGVKTAAFLPPLLEEWQERLNVVWCRGSSICKARDSGE